MSEFLKVVKLAGESARPIPATMVIAALVDAESHTLMLDQLVALTCPKGGNAKNWKQNLISAIGDLVMLDMVRKCYINANGERFEKMARARKLEVELEPKIAAMMK